MIWLWLAGALVAYQSFAVLGGATRISHLRVPESLPVYAFLIGLLWHLIIEPKGGRT